MNQYPYCNRNDEILYDYLMKILILIVFLNVGLYNLFKISIIKNLKWKINKKFFLLIFSIISILFISIYYFKDEKIYRNKLAELIFSEIFLIIYLVLNILVMKLNYKIHKLKKFVLRKFLNFITIFDFFQEFIETNNNQGFIFIQTKLKKKFQYFNKKKVNEKIITLDTNPIEKNIKFINENNNQDISNNINLNFINLENNNINFTETNLIEYKKDKSFNSNIFNLIYQSNIFFDDLKNNVINSKKVIINNDYNEAKILDLKDLQQFNKKKVYFNKRLKRNKINNLIEINGEVINNRNKINLYQPLIISNSEKISKKKNYLIILKKIQIKQHPCLGKTKAILLMKIIKIF